ncbi:MAG: hypothetical protein ABR964_14065 [Tepidisphaeraceae bacterium]
MTTSRTRWLALLLAASPAIFPLVLILRYGVDMPFWDEWDPGLAGMYIKAHQHQLTLADLLAQHNEHRVLIPRLLYLLLNTATHWNDVGDLVFAWGIVCCTSLCVLWLIHKTAGQTDDQAPSLSGGFAFRDGRTIFLWFLCNLLIFSPDQSENWLWGIGLANQVPTLLLFLALVIACSSLPMGWKLGICTVVAVAAIYSSGNGILCGPLVALVLAGSSRQLLKTHRWTMATCLAVFLAAIGLYFIHYTEPTHAGAHNMSSDPTAIFLYTLVFVGGPLCTGTQYPPVPAGITIGSALLFLLAAMAGYCLYARRTGRRELADRMIVWLAVAGYGLLSGFIASFFRAGIGTQQALSSRYVSYALYVPLALVMLLPAVFADLSRRQALGTTRLWIQAPGVLIAAMIVLHVLCFAPSLRFYPIWRMDRRQAKATLLLAKVLPGNPQIKSLIYQTPAVLVEEARILNDMGYVHPPLIDSNNAELIRQTDPAHKDDFIGGLDQAEQGSDGTVNTTGWAFCPRTGQWADAVFLTYDNEQHQPIIFAAARTGMRREDIVEKLGPDYAWCGWYASYPASLLPQGLKVMHVTAWALDADTGKAVHLSGGYTVQR